MIDLFSFVKIRKMIKRTMVVTMSILIALTMMTTIIAVPAYSVSAATNTVSGSTSKKEARSPVSKKKNGVSVSQRKTNSTNSHSEKKNHISSGEKSESTSSQNKNKKPVSKEEAEKLAAEKKRKESEEKRKAVPEEVGEEDISAEAAAVLSVSTGEVVFDMHGSRKLSPGIFTKLMVAVVAIENIRNTKELQNKIAIDEEIDAAGNIFEKGDELTVSELLNILLISDSDEAAVAIANYTSNREGAFVEKMNAKTRELGLEDTHFMNVTGRYDEDQFSTPLDIAALAKYAFGKARIRQMLGKSKYSCNSVKTKGETDFVSENELITGDENGDMKYEGAFAAMTGSTSGYYRQSESSQCMYGASRDGMELVAVLMGEQRDACADDAALLLNYAYSKVTKKVIFKAGKKVGSIRVHHGAKTRLGVYSKSKGYVYIPPEGSDSLVRTEIVVYNKLEAPVRAGTKAGEYRIYVADELKGSVDLVVKQGTDVGWLPSMIYISNFAAVIIAAVLIIVTISVMRIRSRNIRRRKEREKKRKELIRKKAIERKMIEEDRRRRDWNF